MASGFRFQTQAPWLLVNVYLCCKMAGAPRTRFDIEQLGVNFKAPKAARLLHAHRLCDLRKASFV
jgi:hypothetical protein